MWGGWVLLIEGLRGLEPVRLEAAARLSARRKETAAQTKVSEPSSSTPAPARSSARLASSPPPHSRPLCSRREAKPSPTAAPARSGGVTGYLNERRELAGWQHGKLILPVARVPTRHQRQDMQTQTQSHKDSFTTVVFSASPSATSPPRSPPLFVSPVPAPASTTFFCAGTHRSLDRHPRPAAYLRVARARPRPLR